MSHKAAKRFRKIVISEYRKDIKNFKSVFACLGFLGRIKLFFRMAFNPEKRDKK